MTFEERARKGAGLIESAGMLAERTVQDPTLFLRMLGRFSNLSAANLLLTGEQYPAARMLGRAPYWKQVFREDPGKLLRPEWEGKGIDLVLPGFDGGCMRLCSVVYYADGQMARSLPEELVPPCPSLTDIQDRAERRLLQAGMMIDPEEIPELTDDLLDDIPDEELHDAAARVNALFSLYFQGEETVPWAPRLMPALATTAIFQGRGDGVRLSSYGTEQVRDEAGDRALPFLDRVQRLYWPALVKFKNF